MARTPYIFPFQGLKIENSIHFEGQVIHVSNSGNLANPNDSLWKNLKRTYQLYTPTKIKKKERILKIIIDSKEISTPLDKFGYFHIIVDVNETIIKKLHKVEFFLSDKQIFINQEIGTSSLIIDKDDFNIGVISDIDDTILVSHSTNNLKKTALVGFKNAFSRKVVDETKELYSFLDSKVFQFFYVSNSETNLYLLIKWVLKLNGLPDGPIYLKEIRSYRNIFKNKKRKTFLEKYSHKINRIEKLFDYFPFKKFILIGDSSQSDPEIYKYISLKHPYRVKAIFIRNITNKTRKVNLKLISEELKEIDIPLFCYSENDSIKDMIKEIDY
jgi:phosphatidate phosphatase APP1